MSFMYVHCQASAPCRAHQEKGPGFLRALEIGNCSSGLPVEQPLYVDSIIERHYGADAHYAEVSCEERAGVHGTERKQDRGNGDERRGNRTDDVSFHDVCFLVCPELP